MFSAVGGTKPAEGSDAAARMSGSMERREGFVFFDGKVSGVPPPDGGRAMDSDLEWRGRPIL